MSLDGKHRLETPENIEVTFDLAGPGSRFCALLIDGLLMFLLVIVLVIVAALVNAGWFEALDQAGDQQEGKILTWLNALVILAIALVAFGYFTFFEIVQRGQTPGKRSLRLRVLRDDGTPAEAMDIVIRNLLRVVDSLPVFYLVGGLVSLFSSTHQRLGDMAAGTIVVKEGKLNYSAKMDAKAPVPQAEVAMTNTALTPEESRLIRGFLQRRWELLPEARRTLAERLARDLYQRHAGYWGDAESYMERLSRGGHYGP